MFSCNFALFLFFLDLFNDSNSIDKIPDLSPEVFTINGLTYQLIVFKL